MVGSKQSAKSLGCFNLYPDIRCMVWRIDQLVVQALMIALHLKVSQILAMATEPVKIHD